MVRPRKGRGLERTCPCPGSLVSVHAGSPPGPAERGHRTAPRLQCSLNTEECTRHVNELLAPSLPWASLTLLWSQCQGYREVWVSLPPRSPMGMWLPGVLGAGREGLAQTAHSWP